MFKLAIVTTHPIQYHSPWFALLSQREGVELKVFYTWSQRETDFYDKDFGREVKWDIPLLDGYAYEFIKNISTHPNGVSYNGVDCPTLNNKIEQWGATHILVIGWNLKAHLKTMRYFKGNIPVWFRGDSTLLDEKLGVKRLLRRIFLTWVYRSVDKAFYVGTQNKRYFLTHGLKESQLIYAPHSVDNERFYDSIANQYEVEANKWRRELKFEDEDIVLLYAGKFEPRKNLEPFISLFLKQSNKKIKLLLIGNGPLEYRLRELSSDNKNIVFLPFQNQSLMPIVYRLGDIFCLPSQSESWGLALNEAMASKRAIIATNKVGARIDLLDDGINGFVYSIENSNELVDILTKLTKESCRKLGENSLNKIKDFTFEKIVKSVVGEL